MTSLSFRLGAAAFVLLSLAILPSAAGRCAGQELGRGLDGSGELQRASDAQRDADGTASLRVLAAEVRAALLLLRDPDEAYALLKRVLDAIRDDPDLSQPCRERLESRLEWGLGGVVTGGFVVKRLQNEWRALKAILLASLDRWRFQLERAKVRLGVLPGAKWPTK
jgi:hypothetical protein